MENSPISVNTTKFHSSFNVQNQKFDQLHVTNMDSEKLFLDKNQSQPAFFKKYFYYSKNKKIKNRK